MKIFQIYFTDIWKRSLNYVWQLSMSVLYKGCEVGCKKLGVYKIGEL